MVNFPKTHVAMAQDLSGMLYAALEGCVLLQAELEKLRPELELATNECKRSEKEMTNMKDIISALRHDKELSKLEIIKLKQLLERSPYGRRRAGKKVAGQTDKEVK